MSVFKEECFLFLRAPDGGVEDLQAMKTAGFGGVFCNIGDYPAAAWEKIIRPRALSLGMFCGPWARTADAASKWDPNRLSLIIGCADRWESPLVVNSETELNVPNGSEILAALVAAVGDREAALSMEPTPYWDVDWSPVADMVVLPQCFGHDYANAEGVRDNWHARGVECVFPTFGTYSGWQPTLYPLIAPYSLYTGDDCGNNFKAWSPTGTGYQGCKQSGYIPPDPEEDMQKIGSQHGVTSAMNRMRTLDPKGTLLVADSFTGKWPPLSSLASVPIDQWKAYDKLERSLTILVQDHDEQADIF
jgi:hypothetical protein